VVVGGNEGGWMSVARANGRDRSWLVRGGLQPSGARWRVQVGAFSPDGSQVVFDVLEEIVDPGAPGGERIEQNVCDRDRRRHPAAHRARPDGEASAARAVSTSRPTAAG
jgi:hypothetical protein